MPQNFVIWPVVALAVLLLIVVVVVAGIVIAVSSTSRRDESKAGSSSNVGLVITLLLVAIFGILVCGGLLALVFVRSTDRVQPEWRGVKASVDPVSAEAMTGKLLQQEKVPSVFWRG